MKYKRKDRSDADSMKDVEDLDTSDHMSSGAVGRHAAASSSSSPLVVASDQPMLEPMDSSSNPLLAVAEDILDEAARREWEVDRAGQRLGEILVLRGLVSIDQVQNALEMQRRAGGRIGETSGPDGCSR